MKVARRMNPSEPKKPGGNPDELSVDISGQAADQRAYFPGFTRMEDGDEFDTADFQRRGPGSFYFAAGPLKQKASKIENKPVMKSAPLEWLVLR